MTKQPEIHKRETSRNVAEVLQVGKGPSICCDETTLPVTEGTGDGSKDKHVAVLSKASPASKAGLIRAPGRVGPEYYIG